MKQQDGSERRMISKPISSENKGAGESETGFLITATHLLAHLYCPRFTYFGCVLDIAGHEEKRFKVLMGREAHVRARKQNEGYLRKKLGVTGKKADIYLASDMGIRGIVDEVLFLDDGTAAPLDYKYAEYKETLFKTYKFQLVFYAKLIMDCFDITVNRGYIVYVRSKNKLLEVAFKNSDFKELEKTVQKVRLVIENGVFPGPTTSRKRCGDCTYRNICEKDA